MTIDLTRNDGADVLAREVRELVRRRGIDPVADRGALDRLVAEAAGDYAERALAGVVPPLVDPDAATRGIMDALGGLGPLQPYLDDPEIEEIWINSPAQVFVARRGISELTTTLLTADQVRDLVERMLKASGRRLDLSKPTF